MPSQRRAEQPLDVFAGMRYQMVLEAQFGKLVAESRNSNPRISIPAALKLINDLNFLNQEESRGADVELCRVKNLVVNGLMEMLRGIGLESPDFELKYNAILELIGFGERGALIRLGKEDLATRAILFEQFTHQDQRYLAEYAKGGEDPGALHRVRNRLEVLRKGSDPTPRG